MNILTKLDHQGRPNIFPRVKLACTDFLSGAIRVVLTYSNVFKSTQTNAFKRSQNVTRIRCFRTRVGEYILALRSSFNTPSLKCVAGDCPQYFQNYFTFNHQIYDRKSRQSGKLHLPKVRTEIAKHSFYYGGCLAYNKTIV